MLLTMVLATTLAGTAAPPLAAPGGDSTGAHPAPLAAAIAHYQTVENYRVTIHSLHADGEENIVYYYRKPGYVRMEFIKPHSGALLVYSPETGRVRLWPFGYGHFPELSLSPGNPLITSPRGQHVDHSDVGALFENIHTLQEHGSTEMLGEETMNGHAVLHLITTGATGFAVAGVHRYDLWLDAATLFPVKVISKDTHDAVLETVSMDELEINQPLPNALFNP